MKRFYANICSVVAAFGLLICLLASTAKAQTKYYWDINGTALGAGGATPSGVWEDANWNTDSTGGGSPINLPENEFPRFAAGSDATGNYTVTVNSDHTIIGMLHAGNGSTVTITGPGVLTIGGGVQQGFFGGTGGFIRIQSKLTGTGGVISQSGQIYLDGDNDYSGGTTPGPGFINFNNAHSFGTGNFLLNSTAASSALIVEGPAAITIANNWTVIQPTVNLNCVGNPNGITYSGDVNLGANNLNVGCGGSTSNIDIFTGVISGSGGFGRQSQTPAGIVKITGENIYTGKTSLTAGTTWVSTINSVVGGTASSSLGAPTTIANGIIALGGGGVGIVPATAGTLVYTGTGETTDRVIDLASTTGGGTIQNNGSGPLIFTSDFTATGVGVKTLTLRGTNTGDNRIEGKIVNSSSATSVAKSDAGTWTLSNANSYSGNTTLNAGRLNLGDASALGFGTFVIGGNGSFDNTSGLDITIINGLTCSGGSPTYVGSANNLTINGPALITGANRTITVAAHTLTLTLGLGDSTEGRGLTKAGAGVLVFGSASTYTGTTTVSAGTLQFGASNAIASASLIMNGGNLDPGGYNQNLGFATLGLTAASTIDFGPGAVELDFANSSVPAWTGLTLNLLNWDFGTDKLRFGLDATGLTPAELAKIEFNGAGLGTAQLDAQGFVVPEPSVFVLELIGAVGLMRIVRRRTV